MRPVLDLMHGLALLAAAVFWLAIGLALRLTFWALFWVAWSFGKLAGGVQAIEKRVGPFR